MLTRIIIGVIAVCGAAYVLVRILDGFAQPRKRAPARLERRRRDDDDSDDDDFDDALDDDDDEDDK